MVSSVQIRRVSHECARPAHAPASSISEPSSGGIILSIKTKQFDEFSHRAAGWKMEHQLLGRGEPSIECTGVLTPSLHLGQVSLSVAYAGQGYSPSGHVAVVMPLDERPIVYRGRLLGPLEIGVAREGAGYEILNRHGSNQMVASFSRKMMEAHAATMLDEPQYPRHSEDRTSFSDADSRTWFVAVCQRAIDEMKGQPELLANPRAVSLLQDRFLNALLLTNSTRPKYRTSPDRFRVARLAYRYLVECEDVPSLSELCTFTQASYATLERGFREVYGMSPHTCSRAIRLSRARRDLQRPDRETTVTGVALNRGFLELGRFSMQYRERFGESPVETLRKARQPSRV